VKGAIFDLDGVLVDTAVYHYQAWKRLADELGFDFLPSDNERLKGVSRERSLEILLEVGHISATEAERRVMADKKNRWYVEMLQGITQDHLLDGALAYLIKLRGDGVKIALGSASKNAPLILEKTGITSLFDAIVDGNQVTKAKPNPEIFLKAAEMLKLPEKFCVVYEDSQAGIDAARAAGMGTVAVGRSDVLGNADRYVRCLKELL
jgi:beta-phosphoglucomutase